MDWCPDYCWGTWKCISPVPQIWKEVAVAENIIELVDLTKNYGTFTAVNQLNLTIRKVKSWTAGAQWCRKINNHFDDARPYGAHLRNGDGLWDRSDDKSDRGKTQDWLFTRRRRIYYNRSGFENLMLTARLNSLSGTAARQKVSQLLERVGLADEAEKKTGKYSAWDAAASWTCRCAD